MAKSGNKKYNIPNLVRKYYLYKNGKGGFTSEDSKLLINEFKNIVYFKMEAETNKLLTSDDLANQMFLLLDNATLRHPEFFESVLEENTETDKRIVGYVYAFVNTGKRVLSDAFAGRENNMLNLNIKGACKSLIEKGEITNLKLRRYDYFAINDNLPKENYNGQEVLLYPERIIKKDSIDRRKLEEYLLYLFKANPQFKFAIYDLIELVAVNTDVGTTKIFSEVSENENDENDFYNYENLSENTLQDFKYGFIEEALPQIWWDRILNKFGSKSLAEKYATVFYLSFCKGYTLKQIESFYNKTIKSSTVDNYKKIFIKALEINKDIDSDNIEILKKSLNSFYLLLDEIYDLSLKLGVGNE